MNLKFSVGSSVVIYTYGGECNETWSEYGIRIGDLDIDELSPSQFFQLGKEILEHYMLNGHIVEIKKDHEGIERLVEK